MKLAFKAPLWVPHSSFCSLLCFVQPLNWLNYFNEKWVFTKFQIQTDPSKDGYILLSEMPAREILPFPLLHINIPLMSKFVACLIETH